MDRFYAGELGVELFASKSHAKVAVGIKKEFYTGFEKVAAQNRGVYSEFFFTLDEARAQRF